MMLLIWFMCRVMFIVSYIVHATGISIINHSAMQIVICIVIYVDLYINMYSVMYNVM